MRKINLKYWSYLSDSYSNSLYYVEVLDNKYIGRIKKLFTTDSITFEINVLKIIECSSDKRLNGSRVNGWKDLVKIYDDVYKISKEEEKVLLI